MMLMIDHISSGLIRVRSQSISEINQWGHYPLLSSVGYWFHNCSPQRLHTPPYRQHSPKPNHRPHHLPLAPDTLDRSKERTQALKRPSTQLSLLSFFFPWLFLCFCFSSRCLVWKHSSLPLPVLLAPQTNIPFTCPLLVVSGLSVLVW